MEAYDDAGRIDIFINNAIGGAALSADNLTVVDTRHETCLKKEYPRPLTR